jgi:alpha-tubulin suppressor-like RCC1 family protein
MSEWARRYGGRCRGWVGGLVCLLALAAAPANASADVAGTVSAGSDQTCAVTGSGTALCWGDNASGELGNGSGDRQSLTPVQVSGLSAGVSAVSTSSADSCALTAKGGVQCWGDNTEGQLGPGSSDPQSLTPVDVTGLSSPISAIAAGGQQACALTTSGGVQCWGAGSATPVAVLSGGITAISVGSDHACALDTAGGVKCWDAGSTSPVDVTGLSSGISAIAAGDGYTCALTTAGGVQCWGDNGAGQLGNDSTDDSPTPVGVTGLSSGAIAIAAGDDHACAVTGTGAVQCWGDNASGELGNGSQTSSSTPVKVTGLQTGVAAISAGSAHTCAVTDGGAARCWGSDGEGRLGDGLTEDSDVPVPVSGLAGDQTLSVSLVGGGSGTVSASPGKFDCGGMIPTQCSGDFATGSTVVLTASPGSGTVFAGFSGGGCSGGATTCTVTMASGQSVTATFAGPPSVSVTAPTDKAEYPVSAVPTASFACAAANGAELQAGLAGCSASIDHGAPLASGQTANGSVGSHTLVVAARDTDGQQATKTVSYTVAPAPSASIAAPVSGSVYWFPELPAATFSCAAGAGATLQPGLAGCSGSIDGGSPLASGAGLIGSPGSHTIAVIATDTDGQSVTETSTYTVVGFPSVLIRVPAQGAHYSYGQVVRARYACSESARGPGIESCAGTVDSGQPISTKQAGKQSFTVTADSIDGLKSGETVSYTVSSSPSNRFTIKSVRSQANGAVKVALDLPGPGVVDLLETGSGRPLATSASAKPTVRGTSWSTGSRLVIGAGPTRPVTIKLPARQQAMIAHHTYMLTITLAVGYAPKGGVAGKPDRYHLSIRT